MNILLDRHQFLEIELVSKSSSKLGSLPSSLFKDVRLSFKSDGSSLSEWHSFVRLLARHVLEEK